MNLVKTNCSITNQVEPCWDGLPPAHSVTGPATPTYLGSIPLLKGSLRTSQLFKSSVQTEHWRPQNLIKIVIQEQNVTLYQVWFKPLSYQDFNILFGLHSFPALSTCKVWIYEQWYSWRGKGKAKSGLASPECHFAREEIAATDVGKINF